MGVSFQKGDGVTKEVTVFIKALHIGEEQEEIIEEVQGTYYEKNGYHYVFYQIHEDKNEFVSHMLKCKKDQVVLTKKYKNPVVMDFLEEQITHTLYHTPYGSIPLDIHTESIRTLLEEETFSLKLSYTLTADGAQIGRCHMEIHVQSSETRTVCTQK